MSRSGVAAVASIACVVAIPSATAEWSPPLLPTIAREAGSAAVSVRCLTVREWSAGLLPNGSIVVRRGSALLVTDHACSVLVGYATSFPHAPRPGSQEELQVARTLFRFVAAAVTARHLPRGRADCRTLESIATALVGLGVPSKKYAVGVRTRLLVARRRLHLALAPTKSCSVKLPTAAAG